MYVSIRDCSWKQKDLGTENCKMPHYLGDCFPKFTGSKILNKMHSPTENLIHFFIIYMETIYVLK